MQQLGVSARVAVPAHRRRCDPRLGMGVEGLEVCDAAEIDAYPEQLGVCDHGGDSQVAAVGAASAADHRGVRKPGVYQIPDQVGNVVDSGEPTVADVGVDEGTAEARRATHVRREYRNAVA